MARVSEFESESQGFGDLHVAGYTTLPLRSLFDIFCIGFTSLKA
jgi:hypothetical protein